MELTAKVRENLRAMLAGKPEVFAIESDPLLGGLLACLAIRFELNTRIDRLADALGLRSTASGQLAGEILREDGEYGIAIFRVDGGELSPKDVGLLPFFETSSLDERGRLARMVVFPVRVARRYRERGIELVIVRDWILSTCLAEVPELAVDYNHANPWELANNIGFMQAELMVLKRLPFFGTHDIVDHLAGASSEGLDRSGPIVERVYQKMQSVFYCGNGSLPDLMVSYFFGIILDDLAQPRWYGSSRHEWLSKRLLSLWDQLPLPGKLSLERLPEVPPYWSGWVESLRAGRESFVQEQEEFLALFSADLGVDCGIGKSGGALTRVSVVRPEA